MNSLSSSLTLARVGVNLGQGYCPRMTRWPRRACWGIRWGRKWRSPSIKYRNSNQVQSLPSRQFKMDPTFSSNQRLCQTCNPWTNFPTQLGVFHRLNLMATCRKWVASTMRKLQAASVRTVKILSHYKSSPRNLNEQREQLHNRAPIIIRGQLTSSSTHTARPKCARLGSTQASVDSLIR